jgi:hypothetical protein
MGRMRVVHSTQHSYRCLRQRFLHAANALVEMTRKRQEYDALIRLLTQPPSPQTCGEGKPTLTWSRWAWSLFTWDPSTRRCAAAQDDKGVSLFTWDPSTRSYGTAQDDNVKPAQDDKKKRKNTPTGGFSGSRKTRGSKYFL